MSTTSEEMKGGREARKKEGKKGVELLFSMPYSAVGVTNIR